MILDIDKLRDPLPDQQPAEASPTIGKLAAALAKAQGAMSNARKDSTLKVELRGGGGYTRMYADLASVWDALRKPLSDNELAIIQTTELAGDSAVCVVSQMIHSSGEWIRGRLYMPVTPITKTDDKGVKTSKVDAQGFGIALTYARRYALMGLTGIAAEDSDGDTGRPPARQQQQSQPASPERQAARDAAAAFFARINTEAARLDAPRLVQTAKAIETAGLPEDIKKRLLDHYGKALKHVEAVAAKVEEKASP